MVRFLVFCAMIAFGRPAFPQDQLTVAAAADLQSVLKEVATRFEKQTGSKVELSFGSSGTFFAQIQNGAPYDVFFSADMDYPKKLEAAGLAEPGSLYQYGKGKIVLWVPAGSAVDVTKGLVVVADPAVRKLAIANPAHAPYGRAAEAVLKKVGLWQKVSSKLVLGENISQAAQFVQSGNADAGILALSLVLASAMKDKGRYFEVPQELYSPLLQAAVILKNSGHKQTAHQFMEFIKTPEIKSLLQHYGFAVEEIAQ
jgi:molybdate transport system substrate-binding protein